MLYVLEESLLSNGKVTHAFNLLELSLGTSTVAEVVTD